MYSLCFLSRILNATCGVFQLFTLKTNDFLYFSFNSLFMQYGVSTIFKACPTGYLDGMYFSRGFQYLSSYIFEYFCISIFLFGMLAMTWHALCGRAMEKLFGCAVSLCSASDFGWLDVWLSGCLVVWSMFVGLGGGGLAEVWWVRESVGLTMVVPAGSRAFSRETLHWPCRFAVHGGVAEQTDFQFRPRSGFRNICGVGLPNMIYNLF